MLTGAPGAGKTTLLRALAARGYSVVDDSARQVIRMRKDRGLVPRPLPREFAQEILAEDLLKYEAAAQATGYVFFDRSALDALGMLDHVAPLSQNELDSFVSRYPYYHQAFVLPAWEAIYENDSERDQTFAEALAVHHAVSTWYQRCGYEVIEVPLAPVAERCSYVLAQLSCRVA